MLASTQASSTTGVRRRNPAIVTFLCLVILLFDGYDLIIYGVTMPSMLKYAPWGLNPATAGAIGSLALLGMLFGSLLAGALSDRYGRRKVIMGLVSFFSICMAAVVWAPDAGTFTVLRFFAGVGLGGAIPVVSAMTVEFAQNHKRNFNNALMFSGYYFGGILAALIGLAVLPRGSFLWLYGFGALPIILLVPILWRYLPESPSYLLSRGRVDEAHLTMEEFGIDPSNYSLGNSSAETATAVSPVKPWKVLIGRKYVVGLALFSFTSVMTIALVYGLSTWTAQLLVMSGRPLDSSLALMLAMNLGAGLGVMVAARAADRFNTQVVIVLSLLIGAAALVFIGLGVENTWLLYMLIFLAGFGATGSPALVTGFAGTYFPTEIRATALGVILSLGRAGAGIAILLGGLLVAANLGSFVNFGSWAVLCVGAAILVFLVRAPKS